MTRRRWPLSPSAAELWGALKAFDGGDLRPVTRATVEYIRRTKGRWHRRPDAAQSCDHYRATRRLEQWQEAGLWLCRCCCQRCGHVWTEAGLYEPCHIAVRRDLRERMGIE